MLLLWAIAVSSCGWMYTPSVLTIPFPPEPGPAHPGLPDPILCPLVPIRTSEDVATLQRRV